jgi:EmrB/QacA subfamily drug resistance transporter
LPGVIDGGGPYPRLVPPEAERSDSNPSDAAVAPSALLRLSTAAGRWALVGTVLGSGIAALDATVVNIALPRLGQDLHASFAGLQWVVNGYTLVLAALILLGGSFGDRFGRRRTFVIGVIWFVGASALCALAPNVSLLVAARVLQGVGGALLAPGSIAIIQASFHPDDRARAIGAWSGLGGVTTAAGPFIGGWLVTAISWRWIFLLNLPLGLLVIAVALAHIPESRDLDAPQSIDVAGALFGSAGLAGATYGLIQQDAAVGLVGLAMLAAFVVVEARSTHPMLPLSVFRSGQFSATNVVTFFVYGALGASLFLIGLVLQVALGYSPIEAGIAMLPITVMMLAFSSRAGGLAQRIGPRWPMTIGPATMAAGLLLLTRVAPGAQYLTSTLPALLVLSSGLALTVAPLTATVLAAVDDDHTGVASGVSYAVARTGGLVAVAVVPLVAGFSPAHEVAPATLVRGFHRVSLAAAASMALAAVLSWAFVRSDVLAPVDATGDDAPECTYHCAAEGPPWASTEHPPERGRPVPTG